MHKVISVIAIILTILSLGTAQVSSGSEFSCITDNSFQGTFPSLAASFVRNYLFVRGCSGNTHIYLFTREEGVYQIRRDYTISFKTGPILKLCSEGDGIAVANIIRSIVKFRIVHGGKASAFEMRDSRDKLLLTLTFTPTIVDSVINPTNWRGLYNLQFPMVTISFSSSDKITISGCSQASATYSISDEGMFSFKNFTSTSDCDNYTLFIAETMKTFTELSFTDRDSCEINFSHDQQDPNYYSLSARRIQTITQVPLNQRLIGTFMFQSGNNTVIPFKVVIIPETNQSQIKLAFEGCNPHVIGYIIILTDYNRLHLTFHDENVTSIRQCVPDQDQTIRKRLINTEYVQFDLGTGLFSFIFGQSGVVFTANRYIEPIPVTRSLLVGRYALQQDQIQFLITEDTNQFLKLRFEDCNAWNLTYTKSNAKDISFKQSYAGNKKCTFDRDREILSQLIQFESIERNPTNGELRLGRSNRSVIVAKLKHLAGNYSMNLIHYDYIQPSIMTLTQQDDSNLRLTLFGCNLYQMFYKIEQKQSSDQYQVSYLDLQTHNNRECKPDHQFFIRYNLKRAATISFNIKTKQLQITNTTGNLSFSGKQYQHLVPVQDSASLVGKYLFKDEDQVYFVITEDNNEFIHLQMFGCNNVNFTYAKESNGSFSLYRRGMIRMRKLCEVDHDYKYVQLLMSLASIDSENQEFRLQKDDEEIIESSKNSLIGNYSLTMPGYRIFAFKATITEDNADQIEMTIEICNTNYLHFLKIQKISVFHSYINLYNFSSQNGNTCENDYDSIIMDRIGLIDIVHYNATSRSLQLRDVRQGILFEGSEYHELTPTSAENSVVGEYFSVAHDLEFIITDDNHKFIKMSLGGCNPIEFIYRKLGASLLSLYDYITHQVSDQCEIGPSNEHIRLLEIVSAASFSPDKSELHLERKEGSVIISKRKTLFEQYRFTSPDPNLKPIKVRLQTDSQDNVVFVLEGCNSHEISFIKTQRYSFQLGRITFANSTSSQQNQCDDDDDEKYIARFREVEIFEYGPTNANIVLRNPSMTIIFRGEEFDAPAQTPLSQSYVGKYSVDTSSGTIEFAIMEDNEEFITIKFQGCRDTNLTFMRDSSKIVTFKGRVRGLRRYECNSNREQQTFALMKNITFLDLIPDRQELLFVTSVGDLYLAKKESNIKYLLGNHSLYLIDEDYPLKVQINDETLSFWGCNKRTHRYNITARDSIGFRYLNKTDRYCLGDNDYAYGGKFQSVAKFEVNQITGDLRFLDVNSTVVYSTIESDFSDRKYVSG